MPDIKVGIKTGGVNKIGKSPSLRRIYILVGKIEIKDTCRYLCLTKCQIMVSVTKRNKGD